MEKAILIIGSETLLGRKLIELCLNKNYGVAAPVMTSQDKLKDSSKKNLHIIPWNRNSLISAKTVMREALRSFGRLDGLIFVHPEAKMKDALQDSPVDAVEETLNSLVHGSIYLLKEIVVYFAAEEKGFLAFAETEKTGQEVSPMNQLLSGGFHGFSDAILQSPLPGVFRCGFTTRITEMEEYGNFILNALETTDARADGEWLKFAEKKGIFQSLPIVKRK